MTKRCKKLDVKCDCEFCELMEKMSKISIEFQARQMVRDIMNEAINKSSGNSQQEIQGALMRDNHTGSLPVGSSESSPKRNLK